MGDNWYVEAAQARAAAQAQANAQGGGTPSWNSDVRPVVSHHVNYSSGGHSGIPSSQNAHPVLTTVYSGMDVLSQWRATNPKNYNALVTQMRQAGYLGEDANSMSSIKAAWQDVLKDAASLYAQGNTEMSVFDYLWSKASDGNGPGGGNGPGSGSGSGSGSGGPTTAVAFTNEFDARALVDRALNQYLGRDAKPKERENFWKQLNAAEAANPRVGMSTGSSSVTSGGFNPEVMAEDFAKSRNDYAETQASTTLMGWLEESLTNDQRMV